MTRADAYDPFRDLWQLEQQVIAQAQGLPHQEVLRNYWSGIGFSVAGRRFVTPLAEVVEIARYPTVTPVPRVHRWLLGVANFRGQLLPVTDLLAFLSAQRTVVTKHSRLLVVRQGAELAGLLVEKVFGLQKFPVDEQLAAVAAEADVFHQYVRGQFATAEEVWTIFSPQAVAAGKDFFNVTVGAAALTAKERD